MGLIFKTNICRHKIRVKKQCVECIKKFMFKLNKKRNKKGKKAECLMAKLQKVLILCSKVVS